MTLSVHRLHPNFFAEVSGVDFANVTPSVLAEILAAMDEHAVCLFRNPRPITNEQELAFARLLGNESVSKSKPPLTAAMMGKNETKLRLPDGMIDISNLDGNGKILAADDRRRLFLLADRQWHTDGSFQPVRGKYTALSANVVPPEGGNTDFADMRAAYDALPKAMRDRVSELRAVHSVWHSRVTGGFPAPTEAELAAMPPAEHPLVWTHPGSGRKTLYIASHCSHIVGMPIGDGRALLKELMEFATQPRFTYSHAWKVGEVIMWDNRCTMHRGTYYDDQKYVRDMRRVSVKDAA